MTRLLALAVGAHGVAVVPVDDPAGGVWLSGEAAITEILRLEGDESPRWVWWRR